MKDRQKYQRLISAEQDPSVWMVHTEILWFVHIFPLLQTWQEMKQQQHQCHRADRGAL